MFKFKEGDLVRVKDNASEMHHTNRGYEGQLGIVVEVARGNEYPYAVRFLVSGDEYFFDDREIEGASK